MDDFKKIRKAALKIAQGKTELWQLIIRVIKSEELSEIQRRKVLESAFAPLSAKDVRPHFGGYVEDYRIGVSFRTCLIHTRHWKNSLSKYGYTIAPTLNSKKSDSKFACALGIPTPEVLVSDVMWNEVPIEPSTVIKPESGDLARGVFFVDDELKLRSFSNFRTFSTFEEALAVEKRKKFLKTAPVWKVEKAIRDQSGQPAHDFKVYMFYGEVGMIHEVDRNPGEPGPAKHFTYNADGTELPFNGARKKLEPSGIPERLLDYARKVSLATPVPFLRVDFLAGSDGVYLGEITPHPGGTYAGQVFEETDKLLGELFYDAEARLYLDLLKGKKFDLYFQTYRVNSKKKAN